MIGILIVTHGGLAAELLAAARAIAGELPHFHALSLDWREGLSDAERHIADEVRSLDQGEGVLILTDMFGDTPSNAALSVAAGLPVEVVSGVNLPMVVRLGCARETTLDLHDLARWLEIKGRRSIRRASSAPRRGAAPKGSGKSTDPGRRDRS